MTTTAKTDDELLRIADNPGLWHSQDGISNSLRNALLKAAEVLGTSRSPYPIHGPDGIAVEHDQMYRLLHRYGFGPARRPGT
jgi:hypothetical protein